MSKTKARAVLEYDSKHEKGPRHGRQGIRRTVPRGTQLRRTARLSKRIDQVFGAMRAGHFLQLQHRGGHPLWSLSDGQSVTADAAAILTCHALVVPADTALFSDLPGQTWRHP